MISYLALTIWLVSIATDSPFILYVDKRAKLIKISIVSIGGAAALFLGCSFISIAEIIYFITKDFQRNYTQRTVSASQELQQ